MAESSPEFPLAEAELDGWNLIEANAGTGKTYSITGLYLRLLLEQELELEQILVVTFTRAATSELKTRLLARLRETGAALRGQQSDDALIAKITARLTDRTAALARIERAVRAFDLAEVHTIHGFCQRLLNEFSFAIGFDPERELLEDESGIVDAMIRRQWRRLSADFSPRFAAYLAARNALEPGALGGAVRNLLDKPYAELRAPAERATRALERACAAAREALASRWQAQASSLGARLASHRGLHRGRYKPAQLEAQWRAVQALIDEPWPESDRRNLAARLGRVALQAGTRQGFEPPEDPLFGLIDDYLTSLDALEGAYRAGVAALPLAVYEGVREALGDWKRQQSVLTYRDLIMELDAALSGPAATSIRTAVGARYWVALVDEFQDTDPVQFGILRALFAPPATTVFLVGDPKQSLYAFRGADVFAYLEARTEARRRFRLTRDWRAAPALLEALNRLFTGRADPFVLDPIAFTPSAAARRTSARLEIDARQPPPLVAWELAAGATKPALRAAAAAATAAEVERLLNPASGARILTDDLSPQPLRAGDIAVLVRRHEQATEVAAALNQLGIACVQPGANSVFRSDEAEELERVLHGVCFAELPGRLAGAVSTRLLGGGAELAAALERDDEAFETWFERFQGYRRCWEEEGITALLTALVRDFAVPSRWLPRVDGQRRLTNLYHLVELMEHDLDHVAATPGEQLEWLHERRQSEGFPGEEALLRLDGDDDLVTILTIHKSKGLEFPVVLCPYLWDEPDKAGSPRWIEHHGRSGGRLTIDFGSDEFAQSEARHRDEALAENVRLAYVALTRARLQCSFAWAVCAGSGASALGWLLAPPDLTRQQLESAYRRADGRERLGREARRRMETAGIALTPPPRRSAAAPALGRDGAGRFRTPQREIRPRWSVHSYSSLAGTGWEEVPDYDAEAPAPESPVRAGGGIHQLPAGARTGLMVHEIFEELEQFDCPLPELATRVEARLDKFGFGPSLAPSLAAQLHGCLRTPLLATDRELVLARLPAGDTIREMEFYFAVAGTSLDALWSCIRGGGPAPDASPVSGFVRGFIDLIFRFKNKFYIVDYKTNYLGEDDAAYESARLEEVIKRHAYDLQYHLYALALHRYLTRRLPGYAYQNDFGGVLYLFVRGMAPRFGPARGVFYRRPAAAVIGTLNRLLGP